jgi:hypothetical protein
VRAPALDPTEVAGDGNQDMVWVIEALSKETESNWSASPKSQAPSPDPTNASSRSTFVESDPDAPPRHLETA